jgi:hypothetical protein
VIAIRATIPVETPAGLMTVLQPVGGGWRQYLPPGFTFDLAVPCETCRGTGELSIDFRPGDVIPCHGCAGRGAWVHGHYRVLEVLRITNRRHMPDLGPQVTVNPATGTIRLRRERDHADDQFGHRYSDDFIDLPGAVPGAVALIVEQA